MPEIEAIVQAAPIRVEISGAQGPSSFGPDAVASAPTLSPITGTELVASIDGSTLKKNTWTQVAAWISTVVTPAWNALTGRVDIVPFNTGNGGPVDQGDLAWDQTEETLSLMLTSDVVLQVGEETLYKVENNTGSLIADGTPVKYAGTVGNSGKLRITPWDGTDPVNFLGLATCDIAHGASGYVTNFGKVRGIQTNGANYGETWADGDVIYAKQGSAGLTKVEPTGAGYYWYTAKVISANASNGVMFVSRRLLRNLELADIADAGTAAAADTGDFATAAQGMLADSAVQPGDLGNSAGLDVGTTAGTVAAGDDARFTDARTPTAHASSHATAGSDPITPSDIGAATAAQGGLADTAVQPTFTARNNTGSPISFGKAVRITGSVGQVPTIALADNTTKAGVETYVGIVVSVGGIGNNSTGSVQILETAEGLDTSAATEGDVAYVGTSGDLVFGSEPAAFIRKVGVVKNAHPTQGRILLQTDYLGTAIGNDIKNAADAAAVRTLLSLGTAALADTGDFATAAQGTDSREWTADTVDQAEAEAGSATTRRAWTAQRVFQAIAAWISGNSSTGGNGAADAGKVAKYGASGNIIATTTAGLGIYVTATSGVAIAGEATTGQGLDGYCTGTGLGVRGFSVNGSGGTFQSDTGTGGNSFSSTGTYHHEFGFSGNNRAFVARVNGAFGWWRGIYTGIIQATATLTANRTWTLPDKDGTVAMLSDITGTNSGTNTGDQTSIVGITGTLAQFNTAVTDADFASLAGTETLTNKTLTNPTVNNYTEGVVSIGNSGTSQTLALTNGTFQTVTLTGNCTFTMPTATAGKSFFLKVLTGAGGFTATFTSVKWPGGTAPVITATASKYDLISFVADGTAWSGSIVQNYSV